MGISDFLFGKKALEKAGGGTGKPTPTPVPSQSTDYLKEQIKNSKPPTPTKVKPASDGALERLKKGKK